MRRRGERALDSFPSCGPPIRRDPRQVSIDLASPLQQVVVGLEAKPESLRDAEIPCQPQVRIRGDRSFAEYDFVDPSRRHPDRTRKAILRQTHRLDELQQQHRAWVGLGICLMVVDDFDTVGTSCCPNEADTPFPIDADAVLTRAVAFQGFQLVIRRHGEILQHLGIVQHPQLP